MSWKLEAELIMLREIIKRLLEYKEPKKRLMANEIYILEQRILEIKIELGVQA